MEGPIARTARAHIPETWDALSRVSTFGPELLQSRIDVRKYRLFATVSEQTDESSFYVPPVIEFAGVLIAIDVVPSGADFWADQLQTITTTGTSETKSFVDRAQALWTLQADLYRKAEELRPEFEAIYGRKARRRVSTPAVNTNGPFITLDPYLTEPLAVGIAPSAVPWTADRWAPV